MGRNVVTDNGGPIIIIIIIMKSYTKYTIKTHSKIDNKTYTNYTLETKKYI